MTSDDGPHTAWPAAPCARDNRRCVSFGIFVLLLLEGGGWHFGIIIVGLGGTLRSMTRSDARRW